MLAAASLGPTRASSKDEFNGPVAYGDRWLWLALLGLFLVAIYYLAVVWFTRDRTPSGAVSWARADVSDRAPAAPGPDRPDRGHGAGG